MRGSVGCAIGLLSAVVGCGYGDGEGLYLDYTRRESPAECTPARCAIAANTEVGLSVSRWASDWVEGAYLDVAGTDRPDLLDVELQHVMEGDVAGDVVVVRGLAPGRAIVHLEQDGYSERLVLERTIDVVDTLFVDIASRYGNDEPTADGHMQLLANSRHTLVVERRDNQGQLVLGDTGGPWDINFNAAARLEPWGTTGVLQTIIAAVPESVVVASDDRRLPIDIVPASAVASLRVHIAERPELVAEDGQTLHVPEAASFFFVVDAFDASGHYIAGAGATGDFSVSSGSVYAESASGRGFTTGTFDHDVTISLGDASMTVKLVYP